MHLGYAANEMAQRGAQSDRMDALKGVIARNDIRLEMKALDREAAGLEALYRSRQTQATGEPARLDGCAPGMTAQHGSALESVSSGRS